ncbi:MAG: reductive dehalogenase domain-containing protein [Clostridiales bacterium]|jgi:ferredoxin|nr:4Fe-4S binding protein [Eubacteriales bacterium]MDH7565417.1 reductive dehalogenase domain-containing protein [Clostridiales bacterium]
MNSVFKDMRAKGKPLGNFEDKIGRLGEILKRDDVIRSSENSRKQGEILGNPLDNVPFFKKLMLSPILMSIMKELNKSYDGIDTPVKKNRINEEELQKIEKKAKELGALSIGYARVDKEDIFEGYGIVYPNAIVFTIEMDKENINKAPSIDTAKMIMKTYDQTGIVANKLTEFIREMGFGAHAGPGLGGLTIYPVLAEKANLGIIGRHGLLISPEVGPRLRLAVVYTNIDNLPLKNENTHKWVLQFCKSCGKCIRKCPDGAIYNTPVKTKGEHVSYMDYKKCAVHFAEWFGCTVCVKECVFSQNDYQDIKENFFQNKDKSEANEYKM